MKDILEYILLPKADRQAHLRLDEPCIERGGPANGGLSAYCKGLMAHILNTTIPSGKKIHVCHACNNQKCSSPTHLYWGTSQENRLDYQATGKDLTVWERNVRKNGLAVATRLNSVSLLGNKYGTGNAGKPKSDAHRQKIADSVTLRWKQKQDMP